MAAIYEYVYARRKVAETLGTVHSPADVATLLCEYVDPDATALATTATRLPTRTRAEVRTGWDVR